MENLSKLGRDLVILGIVGLLFLALWWVIQGPKRANEKTAAKVITSVAATQTTTQTKIGEQNAKSVVRIVERETVIQEVAARLPTVGDPDAVFFGGVCGSELYKADPQCVKRGGTGWRGGRSRGGREGLHSRSVAGSGAPEH